MSEQRERRSPWWYRQRGTMFGVIYGLGFFFGYLTFGGAAPKPVLELWGDRAGIAIVWGAVACAFAAWLWRASGTALLHRDVVFARDVQRDRLIVAGVFRHVRNPLYLGNLFMALAIAVLAPPLGFAIITVGNVVFCAMLAAEESRLLAADYGPVYEAFRRAVPAFVPRLTPADVPGSVAARPDWGQGLLGEGFCLGLAVALVPLALEGAAGLPAFYVIWIASLVVWAAAGWLAGRPRTSGRAR
jgi:protein-S-isoprenylcysteine O-methyltransferase Ste14